MATSSNLVRVAFIEESTYGVTPGAGNFSTARFTSEALSGTPATVESQQIRIDRMSSGQVVTGLEVQGALNFELAKEGPLDLFMASAMYSDWTTQSLVTVDLTITGLNTLTRASGDWSSTLAVGDIVTLGGFAASANNVQIMVTEVTSATVLEFVGPEGIVNEVGTGTTYKRSDKLVIGTTKKSFSIEKKFTDLTTKGINYLGMIASELSVDVAFGDLITGSVTFSGNDYITADTAGELITNARTVDAAATTQTLNGSVDMPFIATSALGTFSTDGLQVQSVSISLNNNVTPQNVIGDIAPVDYTPGTAQIEVNISAYLTNEVWPILASKLSQDSFGVGFMVKNSGGYYGFFMPAVQVSFEDPASGGQNQDVVLDMSGTAKVSDTGGSALVIYRG
jgi:hypothetical protein